MKRKVTVTIGKTEYTILTEDTEGGVRRAAELVDKKLSELDFTSFSSTEKAILTALNIADDYYKAQDSISALRQQLLAKNAKIERK